MPLKTLDAFSKVTITNNTFADATELKKKTTLYGMDDIMHHGDLRNIYFRLIGYVSCLVLVYLLLNS